MSIVMKGKFPILMLSAVSILAVGCSGAQGASADSKTYYVDFFNNYLREDFVLSSELTGRGNNLIYKTVVVTEGSLVEKPVDPVRKNYDFKGWFLEEKCEKEWNFAVDKVTKNTRLFAKWEISEGAEILEPAYVPPSTVLEDSADSDYVIDSIMYSKIDDFHQIKVATAAMLKLEANKDNVLPLMEYRVKAGKTITATYASNNITVTCGDVEDVIKVKDVTSELGGGDYETKAAKYEAKALEESENYHVMLAGSSSIEFWETSKEDLDPIVSYNHGIGGTTIEQWDTVFNTRLVFPYKPKMVVYYVGINNVINSKESASTIIERIDDFFNHTHAALPNTKVQYILMNQLPGYPTFANTIKTVNDHIIEYQKDNASWLTLINPGLALYKENGDLNAAYFRTDGLHLSYYGYVVWGEIIKQSILDGLKNN